MKAIIPVLIAACISSCNSRSKFFNDHIKDFTYGEEYMMETDSQYVKKDFLDLAGRKVMMVKSGPEEAKRPSKKLKVTDLTLEEIKTEGPRSGEERMRERSKRLSERYEFDDAHYSDLPEAFRVKDEKDLRSVGIIIQKDYYRHVLGKYTDGTLASVLICNVFIHDINNHSYIRGKTFSGTRPPDLKTPISGGSKVPEDKILEFITTVIKN